MSEVKTTGITDLPKIDSGQGYRYWLMTPAGSQVTVTAAPTDDCQTFSVGMFQNILAQSEDYWLKPLVAFRQRMGKKQMLINVEQKWSDRVDKLCKMHELKIVFKQNYQSTRGSIMVFYLIDITAIEKHLPRVLYEATGHSGYSGFSGTTSSPSNLR